jgi:hypothetical protein
MSTDIYLYAVKHKQGDTALLGEFPSLPTDHPSDSVSIRKTIGQWNNASLGEYLEEYLEHNGGVTDIDNDEINDLIVGIDTLLLDEEEAEETKQLFTTILGEEWKDFSFQIAIHY